LLYAPHTSAGRLPTDLGLRLFVDGLLQFGELSDDERGSISAALEASGRSLEETLSDASSMLSGLSAAAGLVLAPKTEGALRHIEFVPLGHGRALVVLVAADGHVENRVIETPPGLPPSALQQAGNYLNNRLAGRGLAELRVTVAEELAANRTELDGLSAQVVASGLATWTGEGARGGNLIVRGQGRWRMSPKSNASPRSRCCSSVWKPRKPWSSCWNWPRRRKACGSSSVRKAGCSAPPACRWWWHRRAARAMAGSSARSA
jgi:heat-inducible transcriptional repressor